MKNVLLLVMAVVASGLAGCIATQGHVGEQISASEAKFRGEVSATETRLRGEMKMADDRLAGQIAEVGAKAERNIGAVNSKLDGQYASLRSEVGNLTGRMAKAEDGQKAASAAMELVKRDVAAVGQKTEAAGTKAEAAGQKAEAAGKRAEVAVREAGLAQREAGVAKVQYRYPGGTRAFLVTGFALGKSQLSEPQKKYIEKISGEFDDSYEVKGVLGFADKTPYPNKSKSDELNTELAKKRAEAVSKALEANGWTISGQVEPEGPTEVLGPRGYNRSVLVVIGQKSSAQAPAAPSAAPAPPVPAAPAAPAAPAPAAPPASQSGTPAAPPVL